MLDQFLEIEAKGGALLFAAALLAFLGRVKSYV